MCLLGTQQAQGEGNEAGTGIPAGETTGVDREQAVQPGHQAEARERRGKSVLKEDERLIILPYSRYTLSIAICILRKRSVGGTGLSCLWSALLRDMWHQTSRGHQILSRASEGLGPPSGVPAWGRGLAVKAPFRFLTAGPAFSEALPSAVICISLAPQGWGQLSRLEPWNSGCGLGRALQPAPSPGWRWVQPCALPAAPTPLTQARHRLAPAARSHGNRVPARVAVPAVEQRGAPLPAPPPRRPGWLGDRQGLNLPR